MNKSTRAMTIFRLARTLLASAGITLFATAGFAQHVIQLCDGLVKGTIAGYGSIDGFTNNTANYVPTEGPCIAAAQQVGGSPDISLNSSSFSLSALPNTITVAAGGSGTSTITVTGLNGFTGSVALTAAITTSPDNAVNPPAASFHQTSPVSITGNAPGAATLTITTTASSSPSCSASREIPNSFSWHARKGALLASLVLFLVSKRSRTRRSLFSPVLLLLMLAGGAAGCGGSREFDCPGVLLPGTTSGTYVIKVTGTSGAITQAATVTLTVQ